MRLLRALSFGSVYHQMFRDTNLMNESIQSIRSLSFALDLVEDIKAFSIREHLGRCIYDGFWVSDTLNVPKKDRIRLDIVEALKKLKIPCL